MVVKTTDPKAQYLLCLYRYYNIPSAILLFPPEKNVSFLLKRCFPFKSACFFVRWMKKTGSLRSCEESPSYV